MSAPASIVPAPGIGGARLADYQNGVLYNPFEAFAFFGGVATGKTYTGSHWVIMRAFERPDLSGLIGANTYDQLSQASLRELFYWLDHYGIPYVIDQRPPAHWGLTRRVFKTYRNILSLRMVPGVITTIFTRVMGDANPLRGVEFSWAWLDETRDTPNDTYKVVLSRLREDPKYRRVLITSTTAGEDWAYENFVTKAEYPLRGAMHVPTSDSVRCGIISPEFLQMLQSNYDPLFADQELGAKHVDVLGGRAYHGFGKWNAVPCPWGDTEPNPDRPLVVGEDFNYDPAPMVWMVGQLGPEFTEHENHIHWFGEIVGRQRSTREQTRALMQAYPGFYYQCFGDASGERGSTSNQGDTDYSQQAEEFDESNVGWSIDVDHANPRVIDRVSNMNRLAKDANGEVHMTYDKQACPHFHADVRKVGWRKTVQNKAKLDDKGDHNLTHATDGGGYAVWKLLPNMKRGELPPATPGSTARKVATGVA